MRGLLAAMAAAAFVFGLAAHARAASPASCDRTCLDGSAQRHMAARVADDPRGLPLARNVRFTENGQTLQLGDGLWRAIERRESYTLSFADPKTGDAGAFLTIQESGRHQLLTSFDEDCARIENGVVPANDPAVAKGGMPVWKLRCRAPFAARFSQFITHASGQDDQGNIGRDS